MTYKDKVRELLKEVPEIEKIMNKLEFGSQFYYKTDLDKNIYRIKGILLGHIYRDLNFYYENKEEFFKYCVLIGLPLQERFIRMYLGINFTIENSYNGFMFIKEKNIKQNKDEFELKSFDVQLDITKDFDNQSEEVRKELFLALTNLTNEK